MERLALIEVLDEAGHPQRSFDVCRWPVRIGRALDNDLVLDDPHVAAHHLHLECGEAADSPIRIQVGATRNGVHFGGRRAAASLASGQRGEWPPGQILWAGRSQLRMRRAADPLADEVRLADNGPGAGQRKALALVAGLFVVLLALKLFWTWVGNEPGARWDTYLPTLLGIGLGLPAWALLWGLGSLLFRRAFILLPHLALVLEVTLAWTVLDSVLIGLAYALSVGWLSHIRAPLEICLLALLLVGHVRYLLPRRARAVAVAGAACLAVALTLQGALNLRHTHHLLAEGYAPGLPPSFLRLAPAQPVDRLIDDLKPLDALLQQRARDDRDNGNDGGLVAGEEDDD